MNPQESVRLWQIFHNKQYYLPPWEIDHEEHDWSIVTPDLLRLLLDFENAFQEVLEPVADGPPSLRDGHPATAVVAVALAMRNWE